ncbi:marine proteobacterial sortase target protein [Novosphingobium profundi]|uniref:marine proteobacterial sortase target protein n=1 Tax=Novosphingobium profundi TaxID=1774954 RepID=UPI001BDAB48A|nr:marine proteobacterial sortase target protein [Novosphingobium profundi]MBT0670977.1 marine proteobacterial sortase target protein [Novosphingobium profundi]
MSTSFSRSAHRRALARRPFLAAAAVALTLGSAPATRAQDAPDPAAGGALILTSADGTVTAPAMRLGSDMNVEVTGTVMRVKVTQAFRNTSKQWMEASYLFPLPEDGAVDTLKMVVGQRVIVGTIQRKQAARELYEEARAKGQKAGLVEAERPNLFRSQVANVAPGETVLIAIEFQAPVRQVNGEFALRLPLVAGPRYVPPHSLSSPAALRDAARVTAPLATSNAGLNPVSITVHLAPGFVPANVISPYHRINVAEDGPSARTVTLAAGAETADRDFELRWRSASADPTLALFHQRLADTDHQEDYYMATITPQVHVKAAEAPAREMVFVIDNSGSMGGGSMDAAKASLLHALSTLRPQDRFNVIRFDDTMTPLFETSMPASAEQVALARSFTQGLEADGGTEMLLALKAALADPDPGAKGVRQVIFLTDGDLSNEREMMAEIAAHAGRTRVFMVGIGSAPNTYLMHRMAEAGRGTYTHIGANQDVLARMTSLLDRIKAPALHDLSVRVEGATLDLTPTRLPDLYAGEPLVLLGKGTVAGAQGRLILSGTLEGKPWHQSVELAGATDSPAIARLWANRRIADVEAARWANEIDGNDADEAIARLGLTYGLVTSQTSLVAIDKTPARPAGTPLTQQDLPLALPKGWSMEALFGQDRAQDRPAAPLREDEARLDLPQTATGYLGRIAQGLSLLAGGLASLWLTRRRRTVKGSRA